MQFFQILRLSVNVLELSDANVNLKMSRDTALEGVLLEVRLQPNVVVRRHDRGRQTLKLLS